MNRFSRPFRRLLTSLLLCAALLGSYAVNAPSSAASTPTLAESNTIANSLLALLNSERAAHGLYALHWNTILISTALHHNQMMAKYNTLSHQLPGEYSLGTRITRAGYSWSAAGENVAYTTDWTLAGATALQKMMYNETYPNDGHRRNILSTTYRDIGLSVYMDGAHHKLWLTEDFARHT